MEQRFAIIPAGGVGTRMGLPYPKQLLPLGDHTVLQESIRFFRGMPVFVPVPAAFAPLFHEKLANEPDVHVLAGGDTRFDSVKRAVDALVARYAPADDALVAVHDAARPFLDSNTLNDAWGVCAEKGAVIFAAAAVDTLKQVDENGVILRTLDRTSTYHAQTPQMFRWSLLRQAYAAQTRSGDVTPFTDEAGLLQAAGLPVTVVPSSHANRKITHREDLTLLESPQKAPGPVADLRQLRIGHGYDVHRYAKGRRLFLGGIEIQAERGLLGHSDADVALHALIDALLGAAGRGDIGHWFPDDQKAFKDIRSTVLLERVWRDLQQDGYQVINCDLTIQAQAPKLAPHLPAMRQTIAEQLQCEVSCINIKATTTERLGFVGREEGMAADAVVLLQRSS